MKMDLQVSDSLAESTSTSKPIQKVFYVAEPHKIYKILRAQPRTLLCANGISLICINYRSI